MNAGYWNLFSNLILLSNISLSLISKLSLLLTVLSMTLVSIHAVNLINPGTLLILKYNKIVSLGTN